MPPLFRCVIFWKTKDKRAQATLPARQSHGVFCEDDFDGEVIVAKYGLGRIMAIAFFAFFGVIVGASLQYLFTRLLEERKHRQSLQTEAYTDYIRAVAEARHIDLYTERASIFARLADAKSRICLYGSPEVIARLAEFERKGGLIVNDEQRQAFMQVIEAMRGSSPLPSSEVEVILLGESEKQTVRQQIYSS